MTIGNDAAKKKSDKKEKKRKREEKVDHDTTSRDGMKKDERDRRKEKKRAEKEELLSKVPKADENGIAYTKIQIKRMMKRVKRGLPPVPTEQEERERIRRLKEEEIETQQELSGMLYNRDDEGSVAKDDNIIEVDENHDGDNEDNSHEESAENKQSGDDVSDVKPPRKKKARSKPVPDDYVCYACKNKYSPLHWIYDCPDKIHNPGSNNIKKKVKGINEPSERKVFVSGLPFDIKAKDVEVYFEKEKKCGKVVHCKLLMFPDTKRCKGTGFVTFESEEGARNALKLSGTALDILSDKGNDNKQTKKQTLTLSVKKVLSRSVTKNKK